MYRFRNADQAPQSFVMQALSCHRASSFDMVSWAPSRDKRVELFSRAGVHQLSSRKTTGNGISYCPPLGLRSDTPEGATGGLNCSGR